MAIFYKHSATSFRLSKAGLIYCIIYEKGTKRELFRSGESKNRSDIAREMQQFLAKNPHLINEVIN